MEDVLSVVVLPLLCSLPLRKRIVSIDDLSSWRWRVAGRLLRRKILSLKNSMRSLNVRELDLIPRTLLNLCLVITLLSVLNKSKEIETSKKIVQIQSNQISLQSSQIDSLTYELNTLKQQSQIYPEDYFSLREFDSKDTPGSGVRIDSQLLLKLAELQHRIDYDIEINSAYRTRNRNALVGGARESAHLSGRAVDIKVLNNEQRYQIVKNAVELGFTRIGIHRRFIHLDVSSKGDRSI